MEIPLGSFVRISSDRVGIVVADDRYGGVLRGHYDIWFGEFDEEGLAIIRSYVPKEDWQILSRPLSRSDV